MTLIGGHSAAGTPSPHGASWFSSTQLRAASAPTMNRTAPVESDTRLAPGAAPWSGRAVGELGRPAGDDAGHVGAVAADRQRVGVERCWALDDLADDLERVADDLLVGYDGRVRPPR